jgi:hypothetical protein
MSPAKLSRATKAAARITEETRRKYIEAYSYESISICQPNLGHAHGSRLGNHFMSQHRSFFVSQPAFCIKDNDVAGIQSVSRHAAMIVFSRFTEDRNTACRRQNSSKCALFPATKIDWRILLNSQT